MWGAHTCVGLEEEGAMRHVRGGSAREGEEADVRAPEPGPPLPSLDRPEGGHGRCQVGPVAARPGIVVIARLLLEPAILIVTHRHHHFFFPRRASGWVVAFWVSV